MRQDDVEVLAVKVVDDLALLRMDESRKREGQPQEWRERKGRTYRSAVCFSSNDLDGDSVRGRNSGDLMRWVDLISASVLLARNFL